MQDLEIKGTGNSRYIKSSIPATTTWDDFLTMLRAGNLPIDLMGLNASGIITQSPSAYNKANVLPDEVCNLIGLPTTSEPSDMFNVLSHVGDLHVWRRTVDGVVDYPVSTNRNAYQEGRDAKPAGYTLGNQIDKNILFLVQQYSGNQIDVSVASSVNVSYDGVVSLNNPVTTSVSAIASSLSTIQNLMSGKFCTINQKTSGSWISGIVQGVFYVPTSATLREETATPYGYNWYIDKYQTVTGYPEIPAGTTIEYLGNLGDKARMQIVSYVGTGTYGENNPCSITADFPIKFAFATGHCITSTGVGFSTFTSYQSRIWLIPACMQETYESQSGFYINNAYSGANGKVSYDKKTITWYNDSDIGQLNGNGYTYYFLVIG